MYFLTDNLSRNSCILILQMVISELPSASVSKWVPVQKFPYENEFD